MAVSFVGSLPAVGANNGGNVTLSFSNLRDAAGATPTLQQGDLVVVAYMSSGTADAACSTSSSNWNELHENYANGSSNDTNLAVYWKVMTASPDTQFVAVGPTGNSNATVAVAFAFRGVDTANPIDVFVSGTHAVTGTGTGRPDPAAITPVAPGAWIIVAGAAAAATGATFTNPGDLSSTTNHFRALSHAETIDGMLGMGIKTDWASGAFNPGAWTSGPNNAGDSWAAMTLSIRPFFVAAPVDAFQGQTMDASSGTPAIATAANDAAQGQTMDVPSITPKFVVSVNDCAQGQSSDASAVTTYAVAAPADAFQGQAEDQPTNAPTVATAADDLAQEQSADASTVTYSATATPDDAAQGQSMDVPVLGAAVAAAADDANQGQLIDQPSLAVSAIAAPVGALQGLVADVPSISASAAATASDAAQGQSADSAAATPAASTQADDAAQGQSVDDGAVTAMAAAAPEDAAQGQEADSPAVSGSGSAAAEADDLAQAQVAASPAMLALVSTTAHDLFQGQTAGQPIVQMHVELVPSPIRRVYGYRPRRVAIGPARPSRRIVPNLQP